MTTIKRRGLNGPPYEHATVMFNSGVGALLCNNCRVILDYGFDHEDKKHFCEGYDPKTKKCTYKY